jgi:hypothetical protein
VPVPGKTLYANRCNIAAETAKALQQSDTHASSNGSNRGSEPGGSTANNQDLGRMDNIHLSGGFTYFHLTSYTRAVDSLFLGAFCLMFAQILGIPRLALVVMLPSYCQRAVM